METTHSLEHSSNADLAGALARVERELAEGRARAESDQLRQRALRSRLKHDRGLVSDLEWELEDLEARLRDLQAQHQGPADPLAERELVALGRQRVALEEQALRQMLEIDALAAEVGEAERALAEALRAWAQRAAELQHEHQQITRLLAGRAGHT